MKTVLFVRTAPLNITPAVERYVQFLRGHGFTGRVVGAELDYGVQRTPATFVDEMLTLHRPYVSAAQRVRALAEWQIFLARAVARVRPDVIQFCDVFTSGIAIVGKAGNARLIFDVRDAAALSTSHYGRIIPGVLGRIESWTALLSDAIVVVSKPLGELLPRAVADRLVLIPNAPENDTFTGYSFSEGDELLVNLAGFVSHRRNLDAWLQVVRREPTVKLDLYGSVIDDQTRALLARHGSAEIKRLRHDAALERARRADAISLMYDPSIAINQYAAPNKYFEALMLGKPILCSEGMHLAADIVKEDCGIPVRYGDPVALREALTRLRSRDERSRLGRNARRFFERNYLGQTQRAMRTLYERMEMIERSPTR